MSAAEREVSALEDVRKAGDALVASLVANDVDGILAAATEDHVTMAPHEPALPKGPALRRWHEERAASADAQFEFRSTLRTREANTMSLKRKLQPMPDFVREALDSAGLRAEYDERPPYQRNDYLGWINRAKRPETKQRRLQQMLEELEAGDRYMNMEWSGGR